MCYVLCALGTGDLSLHSTPFKRPDVDNVVRKKCIRTLFIAYSLYDRHERRARTNASTHTRVFSDRVQLASIATSALVVDIGRVVTIRARAKPLALHRMTQGPPRRAPRAGPLVLASTDH
jgi:hypothetical protein